MVEIERPVICFGDVSVKKKVSGGGAPIVVTPGQLSTEEMFLSVEVMNQGKTSATIAGISANWVFFERFSNEPLYEAEIITQNRIIGINGATVVIELTESPFTLTADQLTAINEAETRISVFGFVRFRDFLGDFYDQGFMLYWESQPSPPRLLARGWVGEGPEKFMALRRAKIQPKTS